MARLPIATSGIICLLCALQSQNKPNVLHARGLERERRWEREKSQKERCYFLLAICLY